MSTESVVKFRTLDGLHLAGTLASPDRPGDRAVVLVHGGGVTREEGGFFTRLAAGLGAAGVASLRFDLRGHGDSEDPQEDLTLLHGTKDTFVPVEDSRAAAPLLAAEHRLMEIEGSQHGFAVHDDPQYLNPQSQEWQALVIETVAEWITASS
jgi:predicted alpha/beta-hydrolase family hydrolase